MPVLRLSEEGCNPDLPFAHRLGVGLRCLISPDPVQICFIEMPSHAPTPAGSGALASQGAASTGRCRCGVDAPLRALAVGQETQHLIARTPIAIRGRVVDEVSFPELPRPVADLRQ